MLSHQKRKLAYCVGLSIAHLLKTRRGLATFATFTFRENVEDKKEAGRRWRRLKERLRRAHPMLRGVGVWQRQARGAWHIHYVFDQYLGIADLREAAMECGFGPMLNLRVIHDGKPTNGSTWGHKRVVNYVTRYVTRDESEPGVRVVDYLMVRVGTTAFTWAKGFSRLWRVGRGAWSDMFGVPPVIGSGGWHTWQDWREFVLRLGMEVLDAEQRAAVVAESDAVAAWWHPEAYPF